MSHSMPALSGPVAARRPLLLLVDDEPAIIHSLYALFRDECEVLMATDGEQAITTCQEQHPDLILLDVVMPGIDGREVCRRLKSDPATGDIAIIFITTQQSAADESLGFALGAVDFITKPIRPSTVRARVRTHLAMKLQSDALRAIALTDGLTGVSNRRRFDEDLDHAWRKCLRSGLPLALIIADIDHFKRYNDTHGHAAGDICLRAVAQAMRDAVLRPGDRVARFGGEEFACVLPGCDIHAARTPAKRMLDAVRALHLEHSDDPTTPEVTVSMGIAALTPGAALSPQDLIAAADQQLYCAKESGRNRICVEGEPDEALD